MNVGKPLMRLEGKNVSTELPGNNELHLNTATVIKALNDYLNEHGGELMRDVYVRDVTQRDDTFVLSLESPSKT